LFSDELDLLKERSYPEEQAMDRMQHTLQEVGEKQDSQSKDVDVLEEKVEKHFMTKQNRLSTLARESEIIIFRLVSEVKSSLFQISLIQLGR